MKKLLSSLLLLAGLPALGQIQNSPLMNEPLPLYQEPRSRFLPATMLMLGGQVNTTNAPSTNAPSTGLLGEIGSFFSPLLQATNYAFEPYATYAPSAPKKWGGGMLAAYNLNNYVAPGLGVDYLGHFSLVSASVTLRLPNHPLLWTHWAWASNVIDTPFVLGGIGSPLSGTSGTTITTVEDVGAYLGFGHLFGGQFNLGACYGMWNNAGDYSGKRYHLFFGWSKGI